MPSAGMRLADGMSKAAVAFLAKQLAAENTHSGKSVGGFHPVFSHKMLTQAAIIADLTILLVQGWMYSVLHLEPLTPPCSRLAH